MNTGRNYDDSDFVSTSVAGKMIGLDRRTVVTQIKKGIIKAHRSGREYRVAKSEIERIKEGRITD